MKADVSLELILGENGQILAKHIELLKAVEATKSITKAAQYVGISYKNAWDSLDTLNNKSDKPLMIRADGNKKNSGTELTEYGKRMIEIYDVMLDAQRAFLQKVCNQITFSDIDILNLQRMGMSLSARNQLSCEITQIKPGAVNTEVIAKLSNNQLLSANITKTSEKTLNLKVGKKVIYIFKAPSVILCSDDNLRLSAKNQLSAEVMEVKIGAVNAEVILRLSDSQTLSSIITKQSAMELKIGVGDRLKAIIKSSQIIIGV